MCRFTRVLLGFTTAVLWLRHAACFTAVRPSTRNNHPVGRVRPPQGHHVFFNSGRRRGCCWRASSSARAGTAAVTKLRISEEDRESLKLERDLERDAQIWVNGDPGKQKLWDKAKAWRKLNQMLAARQEAMSELERDRLRYLLKDAQTVTGLPLLDGKKITPLAWCITLTIQFMPLAAIYIIVSTLVLDQNPQPVLDASSPFWA